MPQIWNSIKAIACDLWKRFSSAWKSDQVVSIVWGAFVSLWLVAIAVGFLFNKWEEVRNFALLSTPLLGFPLLFHRTRLAAKQVDTDSQRLLADRYARSAELFASAELSARLAGLYALWDLAKEEVEIYHVRIMEILCAFVRNPPDLKKDGGLGDYKYPAQRPDMKTVLILIRERSEEQWKQEQIAEFNLDFNNANLQRANFEGAYLNGANFCFADLRGANLSSVELDESVKFNYAVLNGTSFWCTDNECMHYALPAIRKGIILADDDNRTPIPESRFPHDQNGHPIDGLTRMVMKYWLLQKEMPQHGYVFTGVVKKDD